MDSFKKKSVLDLVREQRKDNRFLSVEDIGFFKTICIEITDVGFADVNGKNQMVLSFKGSKKLMVCNKGNRRRLEMMLGSGEVKEWLGKKVDIYADPEVKNRGEKVGGMIVKKHNMEKMQ